MSVDTRHTHCTYKYRWVLYKMITYSLLFLLFQKCCLLNVVLLVVTVSLSVLGNRHSLFRPGIFFKLVHTLPWKEKILYVCITLQVSKNGVDKCMMCLYMIPVKLLRKKRKTCNLSLKVYKIQTAWAHYFIWMSVITLFFQLIESIFWLRVFLIQI